MIMTKNRMNTISITSATVLAVCIMLAVFFHLTGVRVQGSMDAASKDAAIVHAGTEINDYDLVILEEEELPAAAAPVDNQASKALWVMTSAFILVLLIGYELWFENTQARIRALSMGNPDEDPLMRGVNRLHPIKALQARRDMEFRAAEIYFR